MNYLKIDSMKNCLKKDRQDPQHQTQLHNFLTNVATYGTKRDRPFCTLAC